MCLPKEVKEREWSTLKHDMVVMKIVGMNEYGRWTSNVGHGCPDEMALLYEPGVLAEVDEKTDGIYTCQHDIAIRQVANMGEGRYTVIKARIPKGAKVKIYTNHGCVLGNRPFTFINTTKLIPQSKVFTPVRWE